MTTSLKLGVSAEKLAELQARLTRLGVREADFEEKFVRSSGPGGQNVNKVSTAVWLRHVPSGVEVKAQTSRSQALNRFYARRLLAERLEATALGKNSPAEQKAEKLRRQKARRRRRARTSGP